MSWPEVKFEALYAEPSRNGIYKEKQFHGSGCRIVNMGELFGYDFINGQEMQLVHLTDVELVRCTLKAGDLLFGRRSLVEAGAGKCSLVKETGDPVTFESSIIRVRLDQNVADPLFYFYWLKSPVGRGRIRSIVSGTNVKGIRGSDLVNIKVPHPEPDTQRRIATILSSYDDLIENNRKRIKLLERAARLLYTEWFVRGRYPGHDKTKVKDGVPEGWEKVRLDAVAEVNERTLPSKHSGTIQYVDIASVSTGSIDKTEEYEFEDAPGRARRLVAEGDTIWSCVRPNRRSYAQVIDPVENLVVSTGFAVITPKGIGAHYLYHTVTTDDFVGYLTSNAQGAAYPAVKPGEFEAAIIKKPSAKVLKEFEDTVGPMTKLRAVLTKENAALTRARDLLLPRLMSGKVKV